MSKQYLEPISVKLRNEYKTFENYAKSKQISYESKSQSSLSVKPSETQSKCHSVLNTSRVAKDFKLRPFTHVAEEPSDLINRLKAFKAKATQNLSSRASKQITTSQLLYEGIKSEPIHEYYSERANEAKDEIFREEENHREIEQFVDSLSVLSDLKFDLILTYDLARWQEVEIKETDELGFFLNVQQGLFDIMKEEFGEDLEISQLQAVRTVDKFMGYVREVIRISRKKGQKDIGILTEMIWRCQVKLLDSIFRIHYESIEQLKTDHQKHLEMLNITKTLEINKLKEDRDLMCGSLKEEICNLNQKIKFLEDENLKLNDDIVDKELKIAKLTEIDFGFGAMKSMDNLLKNLKSFIDDAKTQKKQKQAAIIDMGGFFSTAKNIVTPIKYKSELTQTDYSFKKHPLKIPMFRIPVLSTHLFYNLNEAEVPVEKPEIYSIFLQTLLEFKPDFPFIYYFCRTVAREHPNFKPHLFSVVRKIETISDAWGDLLQSLLGLNEKLPRFIEHEIYIMTSAFSKFNGKNTQEQESLSCESYLNFIEKTLPGNSEFKEYLLTRIRLHLSEKFEYKHDFLDSFCLKFAIFFEKTKKNLKNSLENLAVSGIPQTVFASFLTSKIKLKCSQDEVKQFWDSLNPGFDDCVEAPILFQHLRYLQFLHISKQSSVMLVDFLSTCLKYYTEKWHAFQATIKQSQNIDAESAIKLLNNLGIIIGSDTWKIMQVRIELEENLVDIVDSSGIAFSEFSRYSNPVSPRLRLKQKK